MQLYLYFNLVASHDITVLSSFSILSISSNKSSWEASICVLPGLCVFSDEFLGEHWDELRESVWLRKNGREREFTKRNYLLLAPFWLFARQALLENSVELKVREAGSRLWVSQLLLLLLLLFANLTFIQLDSHSFIHSNVNFESLGWFKGSHWRKLLSLMLLLLCRYSVLPLCYALNPVEPSEKWRQTKLEQQVTTTCYYLRFTARRLQVIICALSLETAFIKSLSLPHFTSS